MHGVITFEKDTVMDTSLVKILIATLVGVLILACFVFLAPIYQMPDTSYERHWSWNAPTKPNLHNHKNYSPDEIQRMSGDPFQKKIIESIMNEPDAIPIPPVFLGSLTGPNRNDLGYVALFCFIGWLSFVGYVVGLIYKNKRDEEKRTASKTKHLPYAVRRLRDRRR
jgi:hypothetical protein